MTTTTTTCPRCGFATMNEVPARNALSRKDNRTYVCSGCGTDEAMRDFAHLDVWPGYPGTDLGWRSAAVAHG